MRAIQGIADEQRERVSASDSCDESVKAGAQKMRGVARRGHDRGNHLTGLRGGIRAEEDPSQADEGGGGDPGERRPECRWLPIASALLLLQLSMRNQQHTVIAAPYQKQD